MTLHHDTSLVLLGLLLLAGFTAHVVGRRSHIPRVTLLLLVGVAAGPSLLDVVPHGVQAWFPLVAHMALALVGFLLGGHLTRESLSASGPAVLGVSVGLTLGSATAVTLALWLAGVPLATALLLGAISTATAPAATYDVVREGRADGPLTRTLLGVVAVDDAWGVSLFSLALVGASMLAGGDTTAAEALLDGAWELGAAVGLGVLFGIPMAWLTGRLRPGEPALLEAVGFVFVCAGVASLLEASYLLACIVLGMVVANRAEHHERPFHTIEDVQDPFLVAFFLLAGFEADVVSLATVGWLGAVYAVARVVGRLVGARLGARWVRAAPVIQRRIGACLMPQAGVALGLALVAVESLPSTRDLVLPVVIGTTVLFELAGPWVTRTQLAAAGELGGAGTDAIAR